MSDEEELPEWRSKGVSLCGGIVMFDQQLNLQLLTPQNDQFEDRRVFIQELPNPLNNQTWDTPNINDTLSDERSIQLDENGEYCF